MFLKTRKSSIVNFLKKKFVLIFRLFIGLCVIVELLALLAVQAGPLSALKA